MNLGIIPMKFNLKLLDGSEQEVSFDFDTNGDTAMGVADEMVKELQLPQNQTDLIAMHINKEIQSTRIMLSEKLKSKQQ